VEQGVNDKDNVGDGVSPSGRSISDIENDPNSVLNLDVDRWFSDLLNPRDVNPIYVDEVPTYEQAKGNWKLGNGAAIRLPSSAVDFSELILGDAPQIRAIIDNNPNAPWGSMFKVKWRGPDDNLAYKTPDSQYETLGDISIHVIGTLTRLDNGWYFSGSYKPFDDHYNFDFQWSKPWRSTLTLGANIDHGEGTPYDYEFLGRIKYNGYVE
ncbi:hypothetical protein, partial [Aliikangiella maris]